MNLQRFIDAKQEELRALRANMPRPLALPRPDFAEALRAPLPAGQSLRVIAEMKRSSPSAGVINGTANPRQIAQCYAAGGAASAHFVKAFDCVGYLKIIVVVMT